MKKFISERGLEILAIAFSCVAIVISWYSNIVSSEANEIAREANEIARQGSADSLTIFGYTVYPQLQFPNNSRYSTCSYSFQIANDSGIPTSIIGRTLHLFYGETNFSAFITDEEASGGIMWGDLPPEINGVYHILTQEYRTPDYSRAYTPNQRDVETQDIQYTFPIRLEPGEVIPMVVETWIEAGDNYEFIPPENTTYQNSTYIEVSYSFYTVSNYNTQTITSGCGSIIIP